MLDSIGLPIRSDVRSFLRKMVAKRDLVGPAKNQKSRASLMEALT